MQCGFTLIEVLISLLILSFILLGFNAMQLHALRENRNAYYFSVAQNQINSLLERSYAQELSSQQIATWNLQNQKSLPNGTGRISGHYPSYQITIFWGHNPKSGKPNCLTTQNKNCTV